MKSKETNTNIPAIPPNDYEGTMADWIVALHERGYDGNNYYDLMLDEKEYNEILNECESKDEK